jgi:hypothetical protein
MANRSYLYSTNMIPTAENLGKRRTIVGLSESKYSVPIMYRVLLSGASQVCLSNNWTFRHSPGGALEPIAIIGSYSQGLANLEKLRAKLTFAGAILLVEEALAFLMQPSNFSEYLLLEPAEVLSMFEEHEEPVGKLPTKIATVCAQLQGDTQYRLQSLAEDLNQLAASDVDTMRSHAGDLLGFCDWSNVLYQEPSQTGA